MDLSLDEIIMQKRIPKKFNQNYTKHRKLKKPARRSFDARNMIIQKTRARIGDAREILNQNMRDSGIDARQLLQDRQRERQLLQDRQKERQLLQDRKKELQLLRERQRERPPPLLPLPDSGKGSRRRHRDDFDSGLGLSDHNRRSSSRLHHSGKSNRLPPRGYADRDNMKYLEDEEDRKLLFESYRDQPPQRYSYGDAEMSRVPLKNPMTNDPFATYGGSSSMSSRSMSMPRDQATGYRLLVSNLHSYVTTTDIRELFNDIAPVYDARVLRPGTAEVIYEFLEDAEMAAKAYHHRELDYRQMNCVLVNPKSSHRSRTVSSNSSIMEVDINAVHSVLFWDN